MSAARPTPGVQTVLYRTLVLPICREFVAYFVGNVWAFVPRERQRRRPSQAAHLNFKNLQTPSVSFGALLSSPGFPTASPPNLVPSTVLLLMESSRDYLRKIHGTCATFFDDPVLTRSTDSNVVLALQPDRSNQSLLLCSPCVRDIPPYEISFHVLFSHVPKSFDRRAAACTAYRITASIGL